jgi:hypothetical protein
MFTIFSKYRYKVQLRYPVPLTKTKNRFLKITLKMTYSCIIVVEQNEHRPAPSTQFEPIRLKQVFKNRLKYNQNFNDVIVQLNSNINVGSRYRYVKNGPGRKRCSFIQSFFSTLKKVVSALCARNLPCQG